MIQVPAQLLQTIADYLSKQPYREVQSMIAQLLQCRPVNQETPNDPA